jgi:hypothetical protein
VPYRASPANAASTETWVGTRCGLLWVAVACLVSAATKTVGAGALVAATFTAGLGCAPSPSTATSSAALALASYTSSARIAAMFAYAIGVTLFARGFRSAWMRWLGLVAAAVFGIGAIAATAAAIERASPGWMHGAHLRYSTTLSEGAALGILAFLGLARWVEYRLRSRSTGWTWALAGAIVMSVGVWHLLSGPSPESLATARDQLAVDPFTSLAGVAYVTGSSLVIAISCLRLRRMLAAAPPLLPRSPAPFVGLFQNHAAILEAKLALALVLGTLECIRRASLVRSGGLAIVFSFADIALDVLALAFFVITRRPVKGLNWLTWGVLLRGVLLGLVLTTRSSGRDWNALTLLPVVASIIGHRVLARSIVGELETQSLAKSRARYWDATVALVVALFAFSAAEALSRGVFFVAVVGATVIVSLRLLRQHGRAAVGVLGEADDAAAGLALRDAGTSQSGSA